MKLPNLNIENYFTLLTNLFSLNLFLRSKVASLLNLYRDGGTGINKVTNFMNLSISTSQSIHHFELAT